MEPEFEFDPTKSAINHDKHGIDFGEAQMLWWVFGVIKRLPFPLEDRWLRVARLGDRHWSAVFTLRGETIRLISARRARKDEVHSYEHARQAQDEHDHEP